ncbi:hypothetical protein J6590_038894 [Homalodisca vitripennis]|nr:hypothetical protein J6590_038894 [Homalodisca vitripennis]
MIDGLMEVVETDNESCSGFEYLWPRDENIVYTLTRRANTPIQLVIQVETRDGRVEVVVTDNESCSGFEYLWPRDENIVYTLNRRADTPIQLVAHYASDSTCVVTRMSGQWIKYVTSQRGKLI